MKLKRTIYVDMDGVIVDFNGEFLNRFEITEEQKELLTNPEFWELFDTNSEDFFLSCPAILDINIYMDKLAKIAKHHDSGVEILTAIPKLSRYPTAKLEKKTWLEINGLGTFPLNIGPYAKDKQKHCQRGDVLIDDNVLNIIQWNACGGIGIFHHNWPSTLKYLSVFLENQDKL